MHATKSYTKLPCGASFNRPMYIEESDSRHRPEPVGVLLPSTPITPQRTVPLKLYEMVAVTRVSKRAELMRWGMSRHGVTLLVLRAQVKHTRI